MKPVLVVGPHRSGTSATTRAVSLLGPSLCSEDDLMTRWDNPAGHWESESLTALNDELLAYLGGAHLGGAWHAPPLLAPGWEHSPDLAAWRQRARQTFFRVYPSANWVWKDPRLCLLLPFWISALEIDPILVITVRHPLEIARSLMARNSFGLAHALAIWEHNVVTLLENIAGLPVIRVRYDDLLDNTASEVSRLRDSLEGLGAEILGDVAAASLAVEKRHRHQHFPHRHLLPDQHLPHDTSTDAVRMDLHQILLDLDGAYDAFPRLETPRLGQATIEFLEARRRLHQFEREAEERAAARRYLGSFAALDPTAGLETLSCRSRTELAALQQSDLFRRRYILETFIARQNQQAETFSLPGFCLLDNGPVNFEMDWLYAHPPVEIDWLSSDGQIETLNIPNWREHMICPKCGLNNRQRAIAAKMLEAVHRQRASLGRAPKLYLTEQVTPMFRFFNSRISDAESLGSEFLDPELTGGTIRDGLRHENVEALSFADASIDLVMSCSVLEHVNEPLDAVLEMARILRPGGELFLEIPFDTTKEKNTRRARQKDGKIEHLLPAEYHGDPMSSEGALVFFDFGWEFVEQIRQTGFLTCEMAVYWSLELGHLGGAQFFFHARRTP